MVQCYNVIQDIAREEYESAAFNIVNSSSETPVNVLDEHFLSLESEKTNVASSTTLIQQEKDNIKRRKITNYGNNVQFSHFRQC